MSHLVKASGHTRLYRRGAVYYHRAAVPRDIAATYGKREETHSLRTTDRREALRLINRAAAEVDAGFDRHRQEQARLRAASVPDLSDAQLTALGELYYRARLEEDDGVRQDGFHDPEGAEVPPAPVPGYEEYREAAADDLAGLRPLNGRAKVDPFYEDEARDVLSWENVGINLAPGSPGLRKLALALQRAAQRATEAKLARLDGEIVETPPETPRVASKAALPLLSVAAAAWEAERLRAGAWKSKAAADYPMWMRRFVAVVGDRPVDEYRKADGRRFKDVILPLPANWEKLKATRGMTILEAVETSTRLGLAPMAVANMNKGLERVGNFWGWAAEQYEEEDVVITNPVAGLRVRARVRPKDQRHPLSPAVLSAVFASPLYTGCVSASRVTEAGDFCMSGAAKFWVPLLGLFTGARLNEICQLRPGDVQEDGGIPFLRIQEGEGQQLKAAASERNIPLHARIQALGFLDLVADRKARDEPWVFPELKADEDGYRSEAMSRFFTRLLGKLGVKTPRTSFHSLRHNFKDACRAAGVEDKVAEVLSGRETGAVGDRYGSGYPLPVLNANLQRIGYPGLDLSHLPTFAERPKDSVATLGGTLQARKGSGMRVSS